LISVVVSSPPRTTITTTLINLFVLPVVYLRFGFVSEPDTWADELLDPIPEIDPVRG
jgi:hypothetical protein